MLSPGSIGIAARVAAWMLALSSAFLAGTSVVTGLDWQPGAGHRTAPVTAPGPGRTGFSLLSPAETGILFTNTLPESRHLTNQILLNGAGVAAGDVDGDGWCDLYFCRTDGRNALYRNLGNWKFEEITDTAGVGCAGFTSTGCAFADLDGDGDLDLIVNSLGHGTHVFYNDGKGRFTEAPFVLNEGKGGMSLALGDLDGDGYPDLYVANYRTRGLMDEPGARATFKKVDGRTVMETFNGRAVATDPLLRDRFVIGPRGSIDEQGEADAVYRNVGGTNFIAMPFTGGAFLDEEGGPLTKPLLDWGLSVMIRDVNGDGLPDIYVCNDFQTEDRLWINQGGGKLRLAPRLARRKSSLFSMGVDFADINRDGHDDFFVVDMLSRDHAQRMRDLGDATPPLYQIGEIENRPQHGANTLFLNRGDGTYAEIASLSGLSASEWSWSCVFLDVDLDGWEDLLISNGMERAARDIDVAERIKAMRAARNMSVAEIFEARKMFPKLATANLAFRNRGDLTFEETGHAWGFDTPGVSQGMVLADLDNDGDLDLVVNNMNSAAGIYRNESAAPRVAVRLKGLPPNTRGIGAKIRVLGGAVPEQSQEIVAGGRYLSSDDTIRAFAAGSVTNRMTIEVAWRGGRRSVIKAIPANRIIEIDEAAAEQTPGSSSGTQDGAQPDGGRAVGQSLFEDVSGLIGHTHQDEAFDDFARQSLLPNRLSGLGPGVAWFDLDGDGRDDLLIGTGKGGRMAVFHNDGRGGFQPMKNAATEQPLTRDQTSVIGFRSGSATRFVISGLANYEDGLAFGAGARLFDLQAGTSTDPVPATGSSTGPLAMADIDGDGDLDLFVGGRVIPGKYPAAASSRLFRNEGGTFVPDPVNSKVFDGVGLVTAAVFSDIDGDGDSDLLLACEWGPVRLFRNDRGQFTEVTEQWNLGKYTGWWNGIAIGDFDEDGRPDIIAANWGRNTKYEDQRGHPLQVYYGDLNGDGGTALIESHYDAVLQKTVPERQLGVLAKVLPFLRDHFPTHRAFGTAGIGEILGDRMKGVNVLNAAWLETTLFLNRGDHFEAHALPVEAQFSPAFGVCVGDFDGDGHDDVVLAQNFFGAQPETPRSDAGRGLLLKGDGRGGFLAMSGGQSGLKIYGEQRGAAAADFDGDGRLDLAVAQNGAATKLYRNRNAKPGLRVRLEGTPENPDAIGASLRAVSGGRSGPLREIHSGTGWWSQDSPVQVVTVPDEVPVEIQVHWPGGRRSSVTVPARSAEVRIQSDGTIRALAR